MGYNIFNQAHLPLKTALITGCISLSNNKSYSITSAKSAVKIVEDVLHVFHEQLKYEANTILPFIFEYEPSIWNTYISEHHKASNLARNLSASVQLLDNASNETDRLHRLNVIKEKYNEFMLFNFHHMDDEEPVLNEILWRYYPDTFIMQIAEEINFHASVDNFDRQAKNMQIAKAA